MSDVSVLYNLVNQVRLQKFEIPIGEGIHVDVNVVVKVPLALNSKLGCYLHNFLVNFCVAWGGKDSVIHVDNEDDFVLVEHAVFHTLLSEPDLF